jgi:hypothetical protein
MRLALLIAALLLPLVPTTARAECTPAAPAVVAEAERAADDAERKADQADSVSVRSGNPGAARRAQIARQEAVDARKKAAGLACKEAPAAAAGKVGKGY